MPSPALCRTISRERASRFVNRILTRDDVTSTLAQHGVVQSGEEAVEDRVRHRGPCGCHCSVRHADAAYSSLGREPVSDLVASSKSLA